MPEQQYCLRWNNHHPNNVSVFSTLLYNELLVDVTIIAEGAEIHAHKLILSACSTYFQRIFIKNPCRHPIVILKDVEAEHLKIIIDFIYHGEVNCTQDQLPEVLRIAEVLKVKGLTEVSLMKNAPSQSETAKTSMNDSNNIHSNESVRPGPKKRLKTASFQTSGSPMRQNDSGSHSNTLYGNASSEPENSNDSVRTQQSQSSKPEEYPPNILVEESEDVLMTHAKHTTSNGISSAYEPHLDVTASCDNIYQSRDATQPLAYAADQMIVSFDAFTCQSTGTSYDSTVTKPHQHTTSDILTLATQDVLPIEEPSNTLTYDVHNILSQPQPVVALQFDNIARYVNEQAIKQVSPINLDNGTVNSISKPRTGKRGRKKGDEQNLLSAIEAVRKGMGFCRASRMFGVNNRSLWVEYKKTGYSSSRNRNKRVESEVNAEPKPELCV